MANGNVVQFDDEDALLVSGFTWHQANGYARCTLGRKQGYMHLLITNAPKGMDVDHINGNRLDNRRSNLRVCTRSQNLQNQHKPRHSNRFKGIHWLKKQKKWIASIRVNGKPYRLGTFSTDVDASLAYDNAAKQFFGEFARCNNA